MRAKTHRRGAHRGEGGRRAEGEHEDDGGELGHVCGRCGFGGSDAKVSEIGEAKTSENCSVVRITQRVLLLVTVSAVWPRERRESSP